LTQDVRTRDDAPAPAARVPRLDRRWVLLAYCVFTVYTGIDAVFSGGRDQMWAIWAVCGYGIATLLLWLRRGWALPLAVSLGLALIAPALQITLSFPAEDGMVVINRSAELLLHHGSPYLPSSQVTGYLSYNPYLPAMALFGMPAAMGLPGLAGNPGIWLAVVPIVVLWAAFRIAIPSRTMALRCAAIAVASPVIAMNLAVITTDPPVLAFIVLALAIAGRGATWRLSGRPRLDAAALSGLSLAMACALKDTAWLAVPVLLVMFWRRDGRRAAGQFLIAVCAGLCACVVLLAPATLFRSGAMGALVRDTVLFPLGMTKYKTPAGSLLIGHVLSGMGSSGHLVSVLLLAAAGLGVAVWVLARPPLGVRDAAWVLIVGYTLMFALGPDMRFGYFLYPLGLAGWILLTGLPGDVSPATDQDRRSRERGRSVA
jgi:hypothetical protein